ncbi:MAG: helix-turn-helix transcriptional regulator [Clostridia bacterium]|nr:helix-turn-helix transcriptional regulator [Clostridia bacterium]
MDIAKIVGNNLKQARKFKGLTQREVAEKLKMTQQQYSRFENGVFELNYMQILELCNLLDITPNELFTIDL